jgi:hypothetical protein
MLPPEALEQGAGVIRVRRRRSADSAAHLQKPARPPYASTSRPQDRAGAGTPDLDISAGREGSAMTEITPIGEVSRRSR